MKPAHIFLHLYADFDSTVVLQDTGNTLLAHEIGEQELERLDRLPETELGMVSLRRAEDMKWERVRLTIKEAADILIDPRADVSSDGAPSTTTRTPFDERNDQNKASNRSYHVQLDTGFRQFHEYCREHNIPITIVSVGIQPLIEEMLNRYLGVDHGIEVRANGLTIREDGSWRVIWRDSSPFGVEKGRALREARANDLQSPDYDHILWCGDGSADFPAALLANIVLARENTILEKLCRANLIPHRVFTTFETVQAAVEEWINAHPSIANATEP